MRLLFVGRVVFQKGLDVLFRALAALAARISTTNSKSSATATQRPALTLEAARLGLAPRITFAGWCDRALIAERYRAADLFVFPSRDEGMPNVVLEAMASGLPIVATAIAGSEELVREGENGHLVPTEDARRALRSARPPDRASRRSRRAMGRASRERVEREYTWARVAACYLDLLREKCGRHVNVEFRRRAAENWRGRRGKRTPSAALSLRSAPLGKMNPVPMCGISGLVYTDPERPVERAVLERMNAAIRHRGPDSDGFYLRPGIGLAMRRLAIVDLQTGDQPLSNEDGSVWIVFNGEIYNYPQLRPELEKRGHVFRTHSDTEAIVHLYEEYGLDCVQHLRGMFAFAIWDEKRRRLFIARDRVGKKPLYYAEHDGALLFGSELKCLLQYPGFPREAGSRRAAPLPHAPVRPRSALRAAPRAQASARASARLGRRTHRPSSAIGNCPTSRSGRRPSPSCASRCARRSPKRCASG